MKRQEGKSDNYEILLTVAWKINPGCTCIIHDKEKKVVFAMVTSLYSRFSVSERFFFLQALAERETEENVYWGEITEVECSSH